jgi:ABC-2 type transport system ATP-binding protein
LAVALGIGAAIFTGAAVAAADEGATSAGPTASSTSAEKEPSSEKKKDAKTRRAPKAEAGSDPKSADDRKKDRKAARGQDERKRAPEKPDHEQDPGDEPAEGVTTELDSTPALHPREEQPGDAPAAVALVLPLAAAGRQTTDESPQATVEQSYPIPKDVEVTEVVAPLQWLQTIPVAGPLIVTPIVEFIHAIPLVGEALHPLIGWPIDHDAPPGAPQPRTVRVTSFDGTEIYINFMPARGLEVGETAPTVLNGPGLGLPGATTLDLEWDGLLPNDVIGVGALRGAGYNVVTWDPRGEWHSGGVMHLNSPDLEGRDVSAIISWVSSLPEAQLDARYDPRIGMVGASYGGGIQLATAAIDHRVDAIVPTIAWNSLVDVLFPRDAVNSSWGTLLPSVLLLTLAREHPRIFPVAVMGVLFGTAQPSDIELVTDLGYQDQIEDITAPTLLIQGTVDTLFTLDQADVVARQLIQAGTTTKVIWYCGGHGACLSGDPRGDVVLERTLDWLNRYVKNDTTSDVGPQFEWVDQFGAWHESDTYPAPQDLTPVVAQSTPRKTLPYIPFLGGSGPNWSIFREEPIQALLGLPAASAAANAVNLEVPDATTLTHVVGAPELTLTYSGTGTAKHVYAQIVDDETGLVLGNHATPIPVVLDGKTHTVTCSLEQVAHTLKPGQSVTVQVVTSSIKFFNFYNWGSITVEGMSIMLPTLKDEAAEQNSGVAA